MHRVMAVLVCVASLWSPRARGDGAGFTRVSPTRGVTLEIPENWQNMSQGAVDATTTGTVRTTGPAPAIPASICVYQDPRHENTRFLLTARSGPPGSFMEQGYLRNASPQQLRGYETQLRARLTETYDQLGGELQTLSVVGRRQFGEAWGLMYTITARSSDGSLLVNEYIDVPCGIWRIGLTAMYPAELSAEVTSIVSRVFSSLSVEVPPGATSTVAGSGSEKSREMQKAFTYVALDITAFVVALGTCLIIYIQRTRRNKKGIRGNGPPPLPMQGPSQPPAAGDS